jgi:hypothetical protein
MEQIMMMRYLQLQQHLDQQLVQQQLGVNGVKLQ